MERLRVTVRTLSPVVMTAAGHAVVMTASQDAIPGSVIRGVLAGAYIRAAGPGRDAHEDAAFRELFFGGLRYVDAYPVEDGVRAYYLPLSLEKDKKGSQVVDRLREDPGKKVTKSLRGLGFVQDGTVRTVEVRKKMSLHMSRSSDRERLSGKSEDGNIYNYEAISEGQVFEGCVTGPREELEKLRTALEPLMEDGAIRCLVGKSRNTQYGSCSVELGQVEEIPALGGGDMASLVDEQTNGVCLRAETPVILAEGGPEAPLRTLELCLEALGGADGGFFVDPDNLYVRLVDVDNFVGVWGMRRPRETALCPGTAFIIRKAEGAWTEQELGGLERLMHEGIGPRREEGFGQLRFWRPEKLNMPDRRKEAEETERETPAYEIRSEEVRRVAGAILMDRIAAKVRVCAQADAGKAYNIAGDYLEGQGVSGSVFMRLAEKLERALKQGGNVADGFRTILETELEDEQELNKTLHNIYLHNRELSEWLLDSKRLPADSGMDWKHRFIDDSRLMKVMDRMGLTTGNDMMFVQYWTWFFRHGRKQNINKGAGKR